MVCTRTSGKRSTRSTKIPLWRLPLKNRLPRRKNESSGQAEGKSPVHITETLTTTGETNVQDDTYKKDFDDYMTGFLSLLFTCMDDGRVPIAVKELVSERLNKISEDAVFLSYLQECKTVYEHTLKKMNATSSSSRNYRPQDVYRLCCPFQKRYTLASCKSQEEVNVIRAGAVYQSFLDVMNSP